MTTGAQRFQADLERRARGGIVVRLPFDPDVVWGEKDRHYVRGTIGGQPMRGRLTVISGQAALELGPSWCRDPRVAAGRAAEVVIEPEGPQLDTIAPDLAVALRGEPKARRRFESLATFYRNGYVRWIEAAKRAETRTDRIRKAIAALAAGRVEHP